MIVRLIYSTNTNRLTEYVIPWSDVWDGTYKSKFEAAYAAHKDEYRVSEYRAGLVVTIPKEYDGEIDVADYYTNLPKSKVKISEVFNTLCQSE